MRWTNTTFAAHHCTLCDETLDADGGRYVDEGMCDRCGDDGLLLGQCWMCDVNLVDTGRFLGSDLCDECGTTIEQDESEWYTP